MERQRFVTLQTEMSANSHKSSEVFMMSVEAAEKIKEQYKQQEGQTMEIRGLLASRFHPITKVVPLSDIGGLTISDPFEL